MRLRDLREDHDYTQQYVAAYLHIQQNTYSQYETGKRQIPIECLITLERYYRVSTYYLLELTDVATPYPPSKRPKTE